MKRIKYYLDKKHFGNTVSIYDNSDWYFIVIKDRSAYYFSAMSMDLKNYYNIDSQIRRLGYSISDSEEIIQIIDLDFYNVISTEVPKFILLLMQTGSIYGEKIKSRYLPRRKKFEFLVEDYIRNTNSMFADVLKDVMNSTIEAKLLNRLPVFIKHRNHISRKGIIGIHYEGVFNDVWFQCVFEEDGIVLMFDKFIPDGIYSPEATISYRKFENKEDLYRFVIDAFGHYYQRASKNDFDSRERFDNYFEEQNHSIIIR